MNEFITFNFITNDEQLDRIYRSNSGRNKKEVQVRYKIDKEQFQKLEGEKYMVVGHIGKAPIFAKIDKLTRYPRHPFGKDNGLVDYGVIVTLILNTVVEPTKEEDINFEE